MGASVLRGLLAAAALLAALSGHAEVGGPGCELPATGKDPLSDRAGILAQYQRLPRACLQQIFRECSRASERGMVDFAGAAVCSFGHEALLSQHFGGNFRELLAWWRSQPAPTTLQ